MRLEIRELTRHRLDELDSLFSCNEVTNRCWCMWFMIPVKEFHEHGNSMNKLKFEELVELDRYPLGLIAYLEGAPIGWCAVGPRARYARALNTPSLKGRDPEEDDSVWLVPCFIVKEEARGQGISEAMLKHACKLAAEHEATAIEGFPFAASNKRQSKVAQVGFETIFSKCGFHISRRTTPKRIVMRCELLE